LGTTEIAVTGWQASATDFRKHRKPHHTDRNRKYPTLIHQTALSYETAVPDGGRLGLKTPQGNAKARSFRCAGVPGRHERFRRRHPKAHPDSGMTRSMIRDWNDCVRLGGTSVLESVPAYHYMQVPGCGDRSGISIPPPNEFGGVSHRPGFLRGGWGLKVFAAIFTGFVCVGCLTGQQCEVQKVIRTEPNFIKHGSNINRTNRGNAYEN
jgi:hypothetical protein